MCLSPPCLFHIAQGPPSRSIHVVASSRVSFSLWLALHRVCTASLSAICPRLLRSLARLATVTEVAVNVSIDLFKSVFSFFGENSQKWSWIVWNFYF